MHAVAVGIGLDYAHHLDAGCHGAHQVQILGDGAEIDDRGGHGSIVPYGLTPTVSPLSDR